MRFVGYDVCRHMMMFVGIRCLSHYDICRLWRSSHIMTFVAYRVCCSIKNTVGLDGPINEQCHQLFTILFSWSLLSNSSGCALLNWWHWYLIGITIGGHALFSFLYALFFLCSIFAILLLFLVVYAIELSHLSKLVTRYKYEKRIWNMVQRWQSAK